MTWVRIDDRAPTHAKSLEGGLEEFGLWVAGMCYCNLHHNGGRIPKSALRSLLPSDRVKTRVLKRAANELVRAGRWHDRGDHFEVHGYGDEQGHALPEAVEKRREGDAKRQRSRREANEKSTGNDRDTSRSEREANEKRLSASNDNAEVEDLSQRDSHARAGDPGPARPDPVPIHTTAVAGARDMTDEEAELVDAVRADLRLAIIVEPLEIVRDFTGGIDGGAITVESLKRSIARAGDKVANMRAGREAPTLARVSGLLRDELRRTAQRERQGRDRARSFGRREPQGASGSAYVPGSSAAKVIS